MSPRLRRALLSPRLRRALKSRALKIAAVLLVLPWCVLAVAAAFTDLPAALRESRAPDVSLVVRDRHGVILREYRAKDGMRARWIPLAGMGERVPKAIIAAEDLRFWHHPGVDPLSIARAAAQALWHRRLVSGASTLTQQLARTLVPRPRTLRGKLGEMALAARIEASLSKEEILEQYLNRISFGPSLRGIEAASRFYFDKPTQDLSLAEAAALAGMPRGPSLYDPRKGTERLLVRRNTVLERMRSAGLAAPDEIDRALVEPFVLAPRGGGLGAPHLVQALTSGNLPDLGESRAGVADLTLTLDRGLQRTIEILAQDTVAGLRQRKASAAAAVVLDNATGEILAYVGSHDFSDTAGLGQNDGVIMRRQAGSALKPFVYGLAMERLGFTAATLIPDIETHFMTGDGDFAPNNYDGRFHGPVLLREALANSYNVPAVRAAAALGPGAVLARLRDVGFTTLDRSADQYGVAIALGDGETRILDLANAYATLARRGRFLPVRAVLAAALAGGGSMALPAAAPRQVLDPAVTLVLTDILSDDRARAASFGRGSALDLPFPVAAKTGTSKGFRDNLAVGFTREVTVAVWVGNFDGSPMEGVSGITGAGPLFHDAMVAAQALYPEASRASLREQLTLADAPSPLGSAEICPLSGKRSGPDCPSSQAEVFPTLDGPGHAPETPCDMHVRVRIDRRNSLRAGKSCPDSMVEERVFERHPPDLAAWARAVHRPLAPAEYSPLCPAGPGEEPTSERRGLRLSYPPDGAAFVWDPHVAARQSILLRAESPLPGPVVFWVDQHRLSPRPGETWVEWPLSPGEHRIWAEAAGQKSDPSVIRVDKE
jgi:penicillin-binding protein 1C